MNYLLFFLSAIFFGWAAFFTFVIRGDIAPMSHPATPLTIVIFIISGVLAIAGALA